MIHIWRTTSLQKCLLQHMKHRMQCTASTVQKPHHCTHNTPSLKEIRQEFAAYGVSSVELQKNVDSGIATILLNNPAKKNALSGAMMVRLSEIVDELENWTEGKGVILHGAGDTFCSGADLDSTVSKISTSDGGCRMAALMHDTLVRLSGLPIVSVALINGKALGGGAEIATACDFRLFSPQAQIQFVQVRMGVITGFGGGTRLVHLLGPEKALNILLSCQKFSAKEAVDIGLGTRVLGGIKDPLEEAKEWLQQRVWGGTQVVRAVKSVVAKAQWLPLLESLATERELFASVWGGAANKDALQQNIKHR